MTTDSTPFPVKGQAFRLRFRINDNGTGNPITGGLTTLAGTISKDDGAFASITTPPVEIGASGYGYVDLSATEMNCYGAVVRVTTSNLNSVEWAKEIVPLDLSESVGRAIDQTVIRFEQIVRDGEIFLLDRNDWNGAQQIVYNKNGTIKFMGNGVEGDTVGERIRLQ